MKVATIDLGATSGRIRVVKEQDGFLSYEEIHRFPNRTYRDLDGVLRWDFSFLLSEIRKGRKRALERHTDIASIGIDTWGVDYGLLNEKGELMEDPICYRDEGTFESRKELLSKIPYEEIYSITGIQNRHFNTIYQLHRQRKARKGVSTRLLIPDLIAYYLTGVRKREETNASTTGLYDKRKKRISPFLLKQIDVPCSLFPPRIFPGEVYGGRKKEFLPSPRRQPLPVVAIASHDTASAVLASNGEKPFAFLSSGTWSLMGTEIDEPMITRESYKENFTNEVGYGSNIRFLKNRMGRFLINEVRKDYERRGVRISLEKIAGLVSASKDLDIYLDVDDPLFETPGNRLSKIKSYLTKTNQIRPSSPGERRKTLYVSMALTYKRVFSQLVSLTGIPLDSLLVVGGGNRASILNQYTADATKAKVRTGSSEATALGNALCQFIRLGTFDGKEDGRKAISRSFKGQTFVPKDTWKWEKKYWSYRKIVQKGKTE